MKRLRTTAFALALPAAIAAGLALTAPARAADVTEYVAEAAFADVRADLGDAVVNRGYKIDYEAHIGDMLERTSGDVGAKETVYKNAEFVQFCSAVLSRKAMEADPGNIAFCPYVLFVYERADAPGKIHVGFSRLDEQGSDESKAALAEINGVLDEIAQEAANQ